MCVSANHDKGVQGESSRVSDTWICPHYSSQSRKERPSSLASISSEDSVNLDELINANFTTDMDDETDLSALASLELDDSNEDFWKVDNVSMVAIATPNRWFIISYRYLTIISQLNWRRQTNQDWRSTIVVIDQSMKAKRSLTLKIQVQKICMTFLFITM